MTLCRASFSNDLHEHPHNLMNTYMYKYTHTHTHTHTYTHKRGACTQIQLNERKTSNQWRPWRKRCTHMIFASPPLIRWVSTQTPWMLTCMHVQMGTKDPVQTNNEYAFVKKKRPLEEKMNSHDMCVCVCVCVCVCMSHSDTTTDHHCQLSIIQLQSQVKHISH